MYKNSMAMTKGLVIGALAGATVAVVGTKIAGQDKKHLKKNANKALHAVGDLMNNMEGMFRS